MKLIILPNLSRRIIKMAKRTSDIDALNIFVTSVRTLTSTNKPLMEKVRDFAESLQKDLDGLNYTPNEDLIAEAKEMAAILISGISGSDRLMLVPESEEAADENNEEEDKTGSRISSRDEDNDDEDEDGGK
jgi:hypothetical protein